MQVPGREETTWGSRCSFSWAGPLLPVPLLPGSREGRGTVSPLSNSTGSLAAACTVLTTSQSFSYLTFARTKVADVPLGAIRSI